MMSVRLYDQSYWKTYGALSEFVYERVAKENPGLKKATLALLKSVMGRRTKDPADIIRFVTLAVDDATGQIPAAYIMPEVLNEYKLGTEHLAQFNLQKDVANDFGRLYDDISAKGDLQEMENIADQGKKIIEKQTMKDVTNRYFQ